MIRILQYIKKISVLFILVLLTYLAKGQVVNRSYFSDTTVGAIDYIFDYKEVVDGIIISGRVEDSTFHEPLIVKLNISGDVEWSTLNTFSSQSSNCSNFLFELFDDGFIYATSMEYNWPNQNKKMWKVNASTGVVSWVTNFYATNNSVMHLADYDSTSFVVACNDNLNKAAIAIMSKLTGDTILTKTFGQNTNNQDIEVDDNKNIYYSKNGELRKFNLNDLNQLIWLRTYGELDDELEIIHRIYLDQYDDVYLFGHDNSSFGHGSGNVVKVDNQTGISIWDTVAAWNNLSITDLVDINGKLYPTYRHTLVGGGTYKFKTAQIDKTTGNIDWWSSEMMTPIIGYPSGDEQAAMSLDIDCSGDLYLTGYHGDANYGPEDWGIMKLNGQDGTKLYDLTISRDTLIKNDLSIGKVSCVFGDTPVFIGHQEDSSGLAIDPYYVRINPTSGVVTNKRRLGGEYQYISKTVDIIRNGNTTNILKQIGNAVVVEQYDVNNNLQWTQEFIDSNIVKVGQMKLGSGSIFFTCYRPSNDTVPPYYTSNTDKLFLYQLDGSNGNILSKDSIQFGNAVVFPYELEVDNNNAFVFYTENGLNYYQKWNGSFSGANLLETSGSNVNYASEVNLVLDYTSNTYLAAGTDSIYSIDKTSLQKTAVYGYVNSRNYHFILMLGDSLYLVGNNQNNDQLITVINTNGMVQVWEQSYQPNGTLYKIITDVSNNLYVSGSTNNISILHQLSSLNGTINWTYTDNSLLYQNTIPYDIALNEDKGELYIAGAQLNANGSSDVLITALNLQGDTLFTMFEPDQIGKTSQANTLALMLDTTIWVGGSYNTISEAKQGFIYVLKDTTSVQVGVEKHEKLENVFIYPNPAQNLIIVKGLNARYDYSIYDTMGKLVQQEFGMVSFQIDIGKLSKGFYLIRLTQDQNNKVVKLSKQ